MYSLDDGDITSIEEEFLEEELAYWQDKKFYLKYCDGNCEVGEEEYIEPFGNEPFTGMYDRCMRCMEIKRGR